MLALAAAALVVSPRAADPGFPSAPTEPLAAFASRQVWDGDGGETITRAGLPMHAVHVMSPRGRRVVFAAKVPGPCVLDAEISPATSSIAYRTGSGDNCLTPEVVVADITGRPIERFPGAMSHAWSPDGRWLALLYAHYDANWNRVIDRLGIWRVAGRRLRHYPQRPEEICWGGADSLFLGYADRVELFDPVWGLATRAAHRGADVSPDGRYAIRRDPPGRGWFSLTESATGDELCGCVARNAGVDLGTRSESPAPFVAWVRAPGAGHLLWVSGMPGYTSPPGQPRARTVVVEVRTWEVVQSFPGKAVATTTDPRTVVVLRGDSLALVTLDAVREPVASAQRVRIRVGVQQWGSLPEYRSPEAVWTHDVGEGEWLPDHTAFAGACTAFFRVERILDDSRAVVRLADRRLSAPGDTVVVTREPTTLHTNSVDGGYDVSLTLVR
jgi:hypothetical protein